MYRRFLICGLVVCGVAGGTTGLLTYAADTGTPTTTAPAEHERHPEMRLAMRHLREAKKELEKSAHDYHGHRVAAVKLTDDAIKEIEAGIASDK